MNKLNANLHKQCSEHTDKSSVIWLRQTVMNPPVASEPIWINHVNSPAAEL